MMLPFSSRRSSTFFMSNWAYLASRTPSARFSKSQNSAIFLISGCPAMRVHPVSVEIDTAPYFCILIVQVFLHRCKGNLTLLPHNVYTLPREGTRCHIN